MSPQLGTPGLNPSTVTGNYSFEMAVMETLKTTSIQAENADFICQMITDYIAARLDVPTQFVCKIPWQERERLLDAGQIHLGWICGLPYVQKVEQDNPMLELLVAPVMQNSRYQKQPIYFSDVVIHADSEYGSFSDLRGASWAYNEPNSQSGYNIIRYHLAVLGETSGYFGRAVEAGAHQTALKMVLERRIDAAAIDSTVLELESQSRSELKNQLRVIETLGPSPIPPWVIVKNVPLQIRDALRELLLQMHRDPEGQAILTKGQISHFVRVEDSDYDVIRQMAQKAEAVKL
jgi:phosphonate transport system substrate-binding protein